MSPNIIIPMSKAAKGRGCRPAEAVESSDLPFLLAVSRAFLSAVNTRDRSSAVLYSRAMLTIIYKEQHKG